MKRRAGKVNTRTESGRAAIDQAIGQFLNKGPARLEHTGRRKVKRKTTKRR